MNQPDVNAVTSEELKRFIDSHKESDYMIVDVRQPEEYSDNHIPGAQLIPIKELMANFNFLPIDKDLIFYCHGGQRSYAAGLMTIEEEITNKTVYHLEGGITGWEGKKLPHYPRFDVFMLSKSQSEIMMTAMNLEKGSLLCYTHCANHFKNHPLSTMFQKLSQAEQDHAKMIYEFWKKQENSSQSFNSLFNDLSGDMIESGMPLNEVLQAMTTQRSPYMEVIDMSLAIEYTAFDLYRGMADKIADTALKDVFYSLSQAEKKHVKAIINRIGEPLE